MSDAEISTVTKVCTVCSEEKPITEFHKIKNSYRAICKSCRKITTRIYNYSHRKKISDSCKLWRENNKEKLFNNKREYRKNNKERIAIYNRNRKARKRLAVGTHNISDIRNLFKLQNRKCAVCKKSIIKGYHVDHIVSLVNGGTNDKYNLQLLCASCNLSKNDTDPIDFMQSKGMLL
jgi:5-methylcytosine-specific restriction endonuclease McrA